MARSRIFLHTRLFSAASPAERLRSAGSLATNKKQLFVLRAREFLIHDFHNGGRRADLETILHGDEAKKASRKRKQSSYSFTEIS